MGSNIVRQCSADGNMGISPAPGISSAHQSANDAPSIMSWSHFNTAPAASPLPRSRSMPGRCEDDTTSQCHRSSTKVLRPPLQPHMRSDGHRRNRSDGNHGTRVDTLSRGSVKPDSPKTEYYKGIGRALQRNRRRPRSLPVISNSTMATSGPFVSRLRSLRSCKREIVLIQDCGHDQQSASDAWPDVSRTQREAKTRLSSHQVNSPKYSESDSSSPSLKNSKRSSSSSSDCSFELDAVELSNARNFPPRMPAQASFNPSVPRGRIKETQNIVDWVSRFENAQTLSDKHVPLGQDTMAREEVELKTTPPAGAEQHISDLWQRLKAKRSDLFEVKSQMARSRRELRRLRRRKDDADNSFMAEVRGMLVNERVFQRASYTRLQGRLDEMQRLRDDYQVLESNYEGLEMTQNEDEDELSRLETQFFSILATGHTTLNPVRSEDGDSDDARSLYMNEAPTDLRGISENGPAEEIHPLYEQLTETMGDLENAKEEYEDLCRAKRYCDHEEALVSVTGKQVSSEVVEFLEEFEPQETRFRLSISRLQDEVDRLRTLCEGKGIMRKHVSARVAYALDPEHNYEDMELDNRDSILKQHSTLEHPYYRMLLSQPDHVLARQPVTSLRALLHAQELDNADPRKGEVMRRAAKEYMIDQLLWDSQSNSKAEFVNRWLLLELRTTPLRAALLNNVFMQDGLRIRDLLRWQYDVLHHWWRDDTMNSTEGWGGLVTSAGSDSRLSSKIRTTLPWRAISYHGLSSDVLTPPRED